MLSDQRRDSFFAFVVGMADDRKLSLDKLSGRIIHNVTDIFDWEIFADCTTERRWFRALNDARLGCGKTLELRFDRLEKKRSV
jgi:hypothetical protein